METITLEEKEIKSSVNGLEDDTKMTKEELDAIVYEGIAQYERGECKTLRYEDIDKFLGLDE